MMELSVPSWSLPACTLEEVAGIARALGVGSIDLGLFYRSALDKGELLSDPLAVAERVRGLGVGFANYYHLFGDGLGGRNLALPGTVEANARDLDRAMTFADAAGVKTVFILPGIVNPGQSREEAARVSAGSLRALMEVAKGHRAVLCVEPHVHSWAESPALVQALVDATGIRLALDYAHFACLGYRQEEIDPLAPFAAHVHLRQAKMGHLQTKFAQGTLNFPAMFATLRDAGYGGAMSLESVHQGYMDTLFDDVLTEMIAMRDCHLHWKGIA